MSSLMWRQEVLELHVGLMQKQMLTKCCKLYSTLLGLSLLKCVRICHIQARVTTCIDNHCLNDLLVVHTWFGIRLPCAGSHQEEDLALSTGEGLFPAEKRWEIRRPGFQSYCDLVKVTNCLHTWVSSMAKVPSYPEILFLYPWPREHHCLLNGIFSSVRFFCPQYFRSWLVHSEEQEAPPLDPVVKNPKFSRVGNILFN